MMHRKNQYREGIRPIGVYVHLPWCVRKCPYCDFNSHVRNGRLPEEEYVEALLRDLESDLELVAGRRVSSVFFGGGTPSLFSPESIGRVIDALADKLGFEGSPEVTLEANPGAIERGSFRGYARAGVNRISLGVQSFSPAQLQALGRIHSRDEAVTAAREVRESGIDNLNLDLMFALPGQDPAACLEDLQHALALAPTHLSHYQLTLAPGPPFYHRPPTLPDDDSAWDMQARCQGLLKEAGFEHYEVSAWAQPGKACVHNLNYWNFGDYLGIGAGAHGKLTTTAGVTRTEKPRLPGEFMARAGDGGMRRTIPEDELPFEWALNGLRLPGGASLAEFEVTTGLPRTVLDEVVGDLSRRGLLLTDGERLAPSALGLRFLNDVQAAFLDVRCTQ
ncbi:MAG: radical SAM family heme chaperone HemW [Steroidobacteraceae bacterium]